MQSEVFKSDYTAYYDLLYAAKNYRSEANYIDALLKRHKTGCVILELGSGTGNHAKYLTEAGYNVTGVEKSLEMIRASNAKHISNFTCIHSDISHFRIKKKFDAAIALFHVISYLISIDEMISCFRCVHSHLNENGIFIFDVWYTPAVYHLKPSVRENRLQNADVDISRVARPTIHYNESVVEVNYDITVTSKKDHQPRQYSEVHKMKHFTHSEMQLLALITGFEIVGHEEFLTGKKADENTWGVCFMLKRK